MFFQAQSYGILKLWTHDNEYISTELTYKVIVFQRAQVIDVFSGTCNHSFWSISDEVR